MPTISASQKNQAANGNSEGHDASSFQAHLVQFVAVVEQSRTPVAKHWTKRTGHRALGWAKTIEQWCKKTSTDEQLATSVAECCALVRRSGCDIKFEVSPRVLANAQSLLLWSVADSMHAPRDVIEWAVKRLHKLHPNDDSYVINQNRSNDAESDIDDNIDTAARVLFADLANEFEDMEGCGNPVAHRWKNLAQENDQALFVVLALLRVPHMPRLIRCDLTTYHNKNNNNSNDDERIILHNDDSIPKFLRSGLLNDMDASSDGRCSSACASRVESWIIQVISLDLCAARVRVLHPTILAQIASQSKLFAQWIIESSRDLVERRLN